MKVLLTGGSGQLGHYVAAAAPTGVELVALAGTCPLPVGVRGRSLDLADLPALRRQLDRDRPDVIIHAAALTNPEACEADPARARQINAVATGALAEWAPAGGARLAYLSTDLVFGGSAPPGGYPPTAIPQPRLVYGQTKAEGEELVRAASPAFLIVRCALAYSWGPPGHLSFAQALVDRLRRGEPVRLFTDQYRSPIHAADAAAGLWALVTARAGGTWHLAGPERISRHGFGAELARQLGGDCARWLTPITMRDLPGFLTRPADCSLNTELTQPLFSPAGIRDGVRQFLAAEP